MREAGMVDAPMLDETPEDAFPAPTAPGFTAINRSAYTDAAPIHSEPDDKPRASKKRKAQSFAAATASKPKKAAGSRTTKRAKASAQLDCQDISQGLSRTKPTSSRDAKLLVKAGLSFEDVPLEQNPDLRRVDDTSVEFKVKPAFNRKKKQSKPSRFADKHEAAYANVSAMVVDQSTPPTPPKSDQVQTELEQNGQFHGQDPAAERPACPDSHVEPSIPENPVSDGRIVVRDFGVPPFTQTSPTTLQGRSSPGTILVREIDPLDSISDDLLEVDDIKSGEHGKNDEFPMDEDNLEEVMQSTAVPAEEELLGSDWQPQDLSGHALYIDEQLENDQSHWPGLIPDSGDLVIYDEDPISIASDILDVPSSPQGSSQASCILTHVTGNADPNRARTSQWSEHCFDDNDLDDGLLDLMVDESRSLQVASPVTPAKQPLSPKLQWLPPKFYTPARSTRTPLALIEYPHVVPVAPNGDALPFMRPPFPKAVRDRSPILGLTNRTVLRICFRIGEALNAAAVASRTNVDSVTELYARVVSSSREASGGYKQSFQFGDLFTEKPPYLSGTYIFWKGVGVWDNDSKRLVGEQGRGKMVRVLGRVKKKEPERGQAPGVEMIVLSVWEVDWEDIGVAKGIACPKED